MTKPWIEEVFGCRKPIIGMCHLNALPGDPSFDRQGGMQEVVQWARRDLLALQSGGIDAVMFSNEFSMPYLTRVETVTVAAMARIIGELMPDNGSQPSARCPVRFGPDGGPPGRSAGPQESQGRRCRHAGLRQHRRPA